MVARRVAAAAVVAAAACCLAVAQQPFLRFFSDMKCDAAGVRCIGVGGVPFSVRVTGDGGASWLRVAQFDGSFAAAVAVSADGVIMYVSISGEQLDRSADGGATFAPAGALIDPLRSLAITSDGAVLLGIGGRQLWASDDYGATWTVRPPPVRARRARRMMH